MKLSDQPDKSNIHLNPEGYEYIPIGIIEKTLDDIDPHWSTDNYKFSIFHLQNGKDLAEASLRLSIKIDGIHCTSVGSYSEYTDKINDGNMNAICKSYALANAAKSRGIIFGRELNNRMQSEESATKERSSEDIKKDAEIASELNQVILHIAPLLYKEDALEIISQSGFRMHQGLLAMANKKPSKIQ